MRYSVLAATAILVATPAFAQTSIVFPSRTTNTEGTSWTSYPLGWSTIRLQQAASEAKGMNFTAKAISFRRDGVTTSAGPARTVTIEFKMGSGTFSGFSTTFASNWVGTPTTVFTSKTVSLPDWTNPPASTPAPWNVRIPFDTNYTHNASNDLVWEAVATANSSTSVHPTDFDSGGSTGTHAYGTVATTLAAGCKTDTSGTVTSAFTGYPSYRVNVTTSAAEIYSSTYRAPSNSAVSLMVGVADPNLAIPGLCVNLRNSLDIVVPLGTVSSTGFLTTQYIAAGTHQPSWAGTKLYMQLIAPDATKTLPFALSTAREVTLPAVGGPPNNRRLYNLSSGTATSGSLQTGGAVFKLDL